jgi:DNA polymerase III sliding clamp (beta) subunit (PCNA family)
MRRFQLTVLADCAMTAVPSGQTALPVNGCFQVDVSPERLRVAGAGKHLSVFAESPAVSTSSEGTAYIPAKKLKAILSEAPEGDVTVSVKGSTAVVTAGAASWSLRLPPPDNYTGLPDLTGAEFRKAGREDLLAALTAVRHAVGRDMGRPAFAQVRIAESGGVMYACAADANQFARARAAGFPLPVTIPGPGLDDLVKQLARSPEKEVEVADLGPRVVFRAGPVTLALAKIPAAFPDTDATFLRQVQGNDQVLGVDKAELGQALRRVQITADAVSSAVALDIDGEALALTVRSQDKNENSAHEVVALDPGRTVFTGRQTLVVNAEFLTAMLAAHRAAACEFKIGKERGKVRPMLLLEDTGAGITSICTQMVPGHYGY